MNEQDARQAVAAAIGKVAPDVEPEDLDGAARLRQDLELDSLDFLRLVEVISSGSTSQATLEEAMAFCDSIDRLTVRVKDTPGFIVNRLLVPFIFDAIRMVESGTATALPNTIALRSCAA